VNQSTPQNAPVRLEPALPLDYDAAALFDEDDDWATFLIKHMDALGWENKDLAQACGVDRSQVSRWVRREGTPTCESIRRICHGLRLDIRYGIAAAGMFTPDELRLGSWSTRDVLDACAPEDLTDALLRRVHTRNGTGGGTFTEQDQPTVPGTFTEQRKPTVVGALVFNDGQKAV
jgi:transcriptional regulator with XRE-family HTH domain